MQTVPALGMGEALSSTKTPSQRRYDVDWLRTLALGLLIIYHSVISFQSWAPLIGFIPNDEHLDGLWIVMSMINVWRIPVLFVISGMGLRFAMERRNWKQLLADRTSRILLPFVFGFFFIFPIIVFTVTQFYAVDAVYVPGPGHLWFLGNIFVYVLLLLPVLVYLKHQPDNIVLRSLRELFKYPLALLLITLPVILETVYMVKTGDEFVIYAMTWHGFWIGLLCFLIGFIFVSLGDVSWQAVRQLRWIALVLALGLYATRILGIYSDVAPMVRIGFESMVWILAILGFATVYLNRPSKQLNYLSQAVYPVYILHLPVQFILSYYLIPLELPAELKLILLLTGTLAISLLMYEIIKRIKWIRPLFGIKFRDSKPTQTTVALDAEALRPVSAEQIP